MIANTNIPEFLELPQIFCMMAITVIPEFLELSQIFCRAAVTDSRFSGFVAEFLYDRTNRFQSSWNGRINSV
jgi:hypothetical protein